MHNQATFCELRRKDVINMVDGKCLGCITDLVLEDCSGIILGLLVPNYNNKLFNFFQTSQIFIPWQNICKIGEDVILVELVNSSACIDGCNVSMLNSNEVGRNNDKPQKDKYFDKGNNLSDRNFSANKFSVYQNK